MWGNNFKVYMPVVMSLRRRRLWLVFRRLKCWEWRRTSKVRGVWVVRGRRSVWGVWGYAGTLKGLRTLERSKAFEVVQGRSVLIPRSGSEAWASSEGLNYLHQRARDRTKFYGTRIMSRLHPIITYIYAPSNSSVPDTKVWSCGRRN